MSDDLDFELKVNFNSNLTVRFEDIRISHFVLCTYDIQWIGMVCDVDKENNDVQIKFMHPSYPSRSYICPNRDICWVPVEKL